VIWWRRCRAVPNGVEITAVLPDPVGVERGNEAVEIGNSTPQAVDLDGWRLVDRTVNQYRLAGAVHAKGRLRIVMPDHTMPLNQDGDTVMLLDPVGVLRCRVEYNGGPVRAGSGCLNADGNSFEEAGLCKVIRLRMMLS
jgi:hypothetical protein